MSNNDDMIIVHAGEEGKAEHIILYKYVTLKALISFLHHGDLKITTSNDANDPFEFVSAEETPQNARMIKYGFVSFSSDIRSASMWGNYAEKYKGACIEFKVPYFTHDDRLEDCHRANVLADLASCMSKDDRQMYITGFHTNEEKIGQILFPHNGDILFNCLYRSDRYSQKATYPIPNDIPSVYNSVYESALKLHDKVATKSDNWKHEKEYRFIIAKNYASRTAFSDTLLYFSNRITPYAIKVILGPLCPLPLDDVKHVYEISLKNKKVPEMNIVASSFSQNSFTLDIPEL